MGSDPPSASGRDPAAELASISSLQSSLAEYAGGVARDSKGLVVGRLAGGKLQQLLRPRFADPKLEREYRSIAYGSHRGFLCRLLLVGALLGALLFFASLGRELYAGGSVDVIEIALRLASVAVTVAVAVFVRCSRAPTPTAVACMLWLVLLSTVGFFTNQRSAEQSGTPMRESREVLLVYLLSWGVLVPIFPLHFVSLTATVLATTQVLLYILLVPRESSETALNLSFREALKAVCLNLMGFSLASIAEQQYRTNYARAHLYKHEQSSLNDVRNEVTDVLPAQLAAARRGARVLSGAIF